MLTYKLKNFANFIIWLVVPIYKLYVQTDKLFKIAN